MLNPQEQARFDEIYLAQRQSLILQGMSEKTIEAYCRSLRRVVERTHKCPDKLIQQDLKNYFAELVETHSWSTVKIDRNALQFFWRHVLDREWDWIKIVKPPKSKKLPVVLSVDEVYQILSNVERPHYRTCLLGIYSLGLRMGEGLNLRTGDIDSHSMRVHVKNGKGRKDRYVPLPRATLLAFRAYWRTHRNPELLFPKLCNKRKSAAFAKTPMHCSSMQEAMKEAVATTGIKRNASTHTLRHSYATHLMEAGIHMRLIQEYLGHSSPVTTSKYIHLTTISQEEASKLLDNLMSRYLPTE